MYVIDSNTATGIIKISDIYDETNTPEFTAIGDKYIVSFVYLQLVEKFKTFAYTSTGTSKTRYLDTYFRISRDTNAWTEWLLLEEEINNFPPFDPRDPMYLEIKWERAGTNAIGTIKLNDYEIIGNLATDKFDGESPIKMTAARNQMVIKPPHIYKVFKITDIEILADGDTTNLDIKYRFSQDYGRTISDWEILTKENITTVRINPVRFFQIEYLINYTGIGLVTILDVNLIGDFQNVTLDAQKTNVYGIRENCNCLKLALINDPTTAPPESNLSSANTGLLAGSNCNLAEVNKPLTPEDIQLLFKPYQQNQAVALLNKLSNDSNEIFGHEVVYFLTDPDKKGIDYTFHEYQLYNYVCSDLIKVAVDGNNFPDNQIAFNQFDLFLFDTFEIHIPKDSFKSKFGVEKRPSKEDFLWFCELNRMYQVEHAQQFRSFNNSAIYWKIMLKKYVQKSNIIGINQTITDKVKELTKNTTIDELFGIENTLDKKDVANKEQLRPLTQDKLRVDINVDITRELIMNSTTIISKNNYDLSMTTAGSDAVVYRNMRNWFQVSDNFSFFLWFNINNYTVNDTFNFIDYYDDANSKGFKINLNNDVTTLTLNSSSYSMSMTASNGADALNENVWYAYLINVDQRKREVSQWMYKRNIDTEADAEYLASTVLLKLYTSTSTLVPVEFELETGIQMKIKASDMKVTNIRMFNDVIPETEHTKLLNQYLIGEDYKSLIFADNANKRLVLPNLDYSQVDRNLVRTENGKESL
jgi:hypothetical protein